MKESINIDKLFQKAANTPVHTSFDEAKENFNASLARRNAGKWKILRSKNLIIMIAIITSATVAGILLFGSNPETNNSTKREKRKDTKTDMRSSRVLTNDLLLNADNLPSEDQMKVLHASAADTFIPMSSLDQSILFEANLSRFYVRKSTSSYNAHIFDLASDRRDKKDSVEIPTLTEKEIADNEKVKKKMMKALAKQHKDHYVYIPSGSTSYKGEAYSVQAFYMQVNEVSNLQYRTFLNDLLIQERHDEYIKAYPQEYQWSAQIEGDANAMQKMYFTHPAYEDYPVVNVTREGAEMYCKWLSLETSNSKYVDDVMFLNDVRLPQRLEWTYAASNGDAKNVYPWGGPSTQNAEDCYLANYYPDTMNLHADGAFFTAKTGTYHHNDFGLYNMSGNAAEMVYGPTEFSSKTDLISLRDEPGTAGGGWMDDDEALKIEGDDPYEGVTEGHPNIGFRVVMSHLGRSK